MAPAYAYTAPLHAPSLGLGTSPRVRRWCSPPVLRAGAALSGELLRLDVHSADVEHRRHIAALEHVLTRARRRAAVTYDERAAG